MRADATRYSALIERVRAAETKAGLGDALTFAVARAYHKLLAVKDEWEVARLFAAHGIPRGARRASSKATISLISISAPGRSHGPTRRPGSWARARRAPGR